MIPTDGGCVYARAQGEEVEYDVDDTDFAPKAVNVTGPDGVAAVSYTHLTLPTIYSV